MQWSNNKQKCIIYMSNKKKVLTRTSYTPSVLKTMCQVSPGASSPVIFVLRRHMPVYGSFGLYLFVTRPSSCFFDSFTTFCGASVVTCALTIDSFPLIDTFLRWEKTKLYPWNNFSVSMCSIISTDQINRVFYKTH